MCAPALKEEKESAPSSLSKVLLEDQTSKQQQQLQGNILIHYDI